MSETGSLPQNHALTMPCDVYTQHCRVCARTLLGPGWIVQRLLFNSAFTAQLKCVACSHGRHVVEFVSLLAGFGLCKFDHAILLARV